MKESTIKKMNWFIRMITFGWAAAITLAPFGIYIKKKYFTSDYNYMYNNLIRHETIHWHQQMEMLIIPFYLWYFIEWIVRLFTNTSNAYTSISFEREANVNERNKDYLNRRKPFSWFIYL